ncbi:MAG: type II secretion system protein [Planctomycetota bacterium]
MLHDEKRVDRETGDVFSTHRVAQRAHPVLARAFTLIELLTVVAIVAVLIGVTVSVATGVREGGRVRLTTDTLRMTDVAIDTFIAETGGPPPSFVEVADPTATAGTAAPPVVLPIADAADMTGITDASREGERRTINSIGLFVQAAENAGLTSLFDGVPTQQFARIDGDDLKPRPDDTSSRNHQPELRTIVDAWGAPIRFVHPVFDGVITQEFDAGQKRQNGRPGTSLLVTSQNAGENNQPYIVARTEVPLSVKTADQGEGASDQFGRYGVDPARFPINRVRRNVISQADRDAWVPAGTPVGDGDGGICQGGRPYVYSAGRDGDPSTVRARDGEKFDNIYTTEPRFIDGGTAQ